MITLVEITARLIRNQHTRITHIHLGVDSKSSVIVLNLM